MATFVSKWLILFLLVPMLLRAADDDATWSKTVNDLGARLFISPLQKDEGGHLQFGLYLQFRRNDHMFGYLKIPYTPNNLALKVIDQDGKELPLRPVAGNQLEAPWIPLLLPDDSTLSFRIGESNWQESGPMKGEFIDFHFWTQWQLLPRGPSTYYITGTFSIPAASSKLSDIRPMNTDGTRGWTGTLLLPKVEIPNIL